MDFFPLNSSTPFPPKVQAEKSGDPDRPQFLTVLFSLPAGFLPFSEVVWETAVPWGGEMKAISTNHPV